MIESDLLNLGGGPKTPNGIYRVTILALACVVLLVYGHVFDIWLLTWNGELVLANLLFFATLTGVIIIILLSYKTQVESNLR